MRRKKTGYILLALLVITGLAGTISGSISGKERRVALNLMKNSKTNVLLSLKGLTGTQLNFKAAADKWSAKECMYHIAVSENDLWNILQASLKLPANPEKRSAIQMTDEQVISLMENTGHKSTEPGKPLTATYTSLNDAVNDFKKTRTQHIEYMKSTTEDLRDHIVHTSFGWVDCYQLCLIIASHSDRYVRQINESKEGTRISKTK